MQYTILSTFLLAATALAATTADADVATASSYMTPTDDSSDSSVESMLDNIPTSIMSVMETAIPVSWDESLFDPTSYSSILSEAEAGIYPAWYSSLPSDVKAYFTALGGVANLISESSPTGVSSSDSSSSDSDTSDSGSNAATITSAAVTAAPTSTVASTLTSAQKTSTPADSSSSAAASTTHSSSTSTGGAPAATGAIALSVAGAAGLLGLALAL